MSITLTQSEIDYLARTPEALQLVIDHHHQQEAEADGIGESELRACIEYSERRRKLLEETRDQLLTQRGDKTGDMLIVNAYDR